MRLLFLVLLLIATPSLAQELYFEGQVGTTIEFGEEQKKLATELGLVYEGMPKEDLYKTGFTEYLQKDYRREGNDEWITFSDWTTNERGDLITFRLKDGKVVDWERPKKEVVIPKI